MSQRCARNIPGPALLTAAFSRRLSLLPKMGRGAAVGYVDADWMRNLDNRRSVGAHVFLRSGAAISWLSKLQNCVASSTREAEYVATTYTAQHAVWLRRLASCLGLEVSSPTLLDEDNRSCVALASDVFSEHRGKHINIKFHIVRKQVASGATTLVPKKAVDQLADLLTKPLPVPRIRTYGKIYQGIIDCRLDGRQLLIFHDCLITGGCWNAAQSSRSPMPVWRQE
ncbi:unnamed protein product [Phaeothamnion confervicola]